MADDQVRFIALPSGREMGDCGSVPNVLSACYLDVTRVETTQLLAQL